MLLNSEIWTKYAPKVKLATNATERADFLARAIAEGFSCGDNVKINDLASQCGLSKGLVASAIHTAAEAGLVYKSGALFWRSDKPADDFLAERASALDVATYRPPHVYYHKRADGNVFKWYPLGTIIDLDGRKLAVLKSAPNHCQYCADCYLLTVSPQECQRIKNDSLGECYSMDRGDKTRVIFHAIGTGMTSEKAALINVRAGLARYF